MVTASGNDTDAALPALPEKAYIMGFAGPLTEGLQLDPIFQAMREIPALHFLIYGTGDKERHFKDMTYKRGVHDRVHFIPSDINPAAFYDVLDLVIIPIQKQDSLRGLLQAWAYNLPVLVCDDPANTPVIEGQTGRIASPYDIFAIRHALREIIETPEKHAGIADAGTALFEQKYTQKAILGQYLNTYKKWLST